MFPATMFFGPLLLGYGPHCFLMTHGVLAAEPALIYSRLLAAVAVISLAVGIWLIQWESPPSDLIVSFYTLGTLIATMVVTGLMSLRVHQAAKKVAIEQVLVEQGDEIDVLLDQEYVKDP